MNARLEGRLPPEFIRPVIDRARPLRFRLNGRSVSGFEGDSVLSALLASGVRAAGVFGGSPLALDEYTAPAIVVAGNEGRPDLAMPMALCPAIDGASFTTTGPKPGAPASPLARILMRRRDTLGLVYRTGAAEPGGWIDTPADRHITADVAVVGGGVAGLSAALAAAERGLRVCLVEKEPTLGGMSAFFGKADGEPPPDEMIGSLVEKLGQSGLVSVLPATLAFDLHDRRLEAVRVTRVGSIPQPERISITAQTVVLATGTLGRLPIFPGNRLPGVVEAGFAWRTAARYNVWPGQSAFIHTATNVGYRLALLGAASGKSVLRASDARINPQTRFIEFCKAYGYRLGWGTAIASVSPARRNALSVETADAETGVLGDEAVLCDRVIVSAGWQPDLDLWLKAAGAAAWDAETQRLIPTGALEGVVLAGSIAGYSTLAGCVEHGRVALEGENREVADPRIDPVFETPDGPLTLSPPRASATAPAFTAPGTGQTLTPPPARGWGRIAQLTSDRPTPGRGPLSALEIVGEIIAGRLDPEFVTNLCAERCVLPRLLVAKEVPPAAHRHAQDDLPAYLEHRFGSAQAQWTLTAGMPRRFDPGCLVFTNTDRHSPFDAIGVVLSSEAGNIRAILNAADMRPGDMVYVRDGSTAVPVRLERAL